VVQPGNHYPVIHFIIDPSDSIHYCRVGRSFTLDASAPQQIPNIDSLQLLENHYGYLEIIHQSGDHTELVYFDAYTDMGRDPGRFADDGNMVMTLQYKFSAGDRCILYLYLPDADMISSAETTIVGPLTVFDPATIPGRELTLTPEQGYTLRWFTAPFAEVYQPSVFVNYIEYDSASSIPKQVRIPLGLRFIDLESNQVSQFMSGAHFYRSLQKEIPVVPHVTRDIISLDFEIAYGSEELALAVAEATFGKNDFGNIRDYTNVDRGVGFIASRSYRLVKNIRLSYITKDSLASSVYTKDLNFISSSKSP